MTCLFCSEEIRPDDALNLHHPIYRSNGGTDMQPSHVRCHRQFHIDQGDFKAWGRIGGLITAATRRWALNLKNVRNHPGYESSREYYRAMYAH